MIHASAMMFLLTACARSEQAPAPGRSDGAHGARRSRSERSPALGSPDGTPGAVPRAGGLSSRLPTDAPILLFLGTSLTAGLGVDPDSAYPAVVQRRLDSLGLGWRVVNAGLSGETSAGARRRLDWLLQGPIRVLVIETGANDGLRGQGVDSTRANLEAIIARARVYDSTMTIVLAGMEVPPNLGPRYASAFRALFRDLARSEHLPLIPFLLEGVGGVDSLNQADGIHPTPAGHRIVAENVRRVVGPLMERTGQRASGPAR